MSIPFAAALTFCAGSCILYYMARTARQRAQSGVYYILVSSLDKLLFVEEADRSVFAAILAECADDMTDVWAYALEDERIHLVVKEGLDGVSRFVRKVLSRYAVRYNAKYRREGRLFADRFRSLPLEEPDEMLEAVRYVFSVCGYRPVATNYAEFIRQNEELSLYAGGQAALKAYFGQTGTFRGFERDVVSDADLLAAARSILLDIGEDKLDRLNETEYLAVLKKILSIKGATVGQVSRVCGISRRQLEKAAAMEAL